MKGCARSCLLWLLGWGAAAYAFYFFFTSLHHFGPPTYWGSAVAGLFVVAAVGYALGIGTAYRERKTLLDAMTGTPPEDGRWVAVSGTIQTTHPLTAPISGQAAVAYEYKISREEGTGKGHAEVVYCEGKALAPSTISTRQGTVRLLAVPAFTEVDNSEIPSSAAAENARAYIEQTTFQERDTSKKRREALEAEWTDDDGQFRSDKKRHNLPDDFPTGFQFQEKRIHQGEQICAFGLFSRERGGIVPHPNWAKHTRIMRGDAASVASRLRSRMVKYFAGAVIFGALAYGIVLLYQHEVAKLS
jgi:hypothetical protein